MKKRITLRKQTIRVLSGLDIVRGGVRDISDIVGGCTATTTGNDTEDCPATKWPTEVNC